MNIRNAWHTLMNPPTDGPRATLALRLMAGGVFLWEGIMKFLYPSLGVGRFTKLGFPMPGFTADFVAWVEILGGICFIIGWLTRPVAIAFLIEMIVAMLSTKIGVFLGTSPLGRPAAPPQLGLGAVLHDIRSDYAQFMTSLYLLCAGPGPWSMDARKKKTGAELLRAIAAVAVLLWSASVVRASQSFPALSSKGSTDITAQASQALAMKDYKKADELLVGALRQHPADPDLLNDYAFTQRKLGHLDEAFEYYEKALRERNRFPEAREYLGEAHLQAALREMDALKSYGADGKEELDELRRSIKEAASAL